MTGMIRRWRLYLARRALRRARAATQQAREEFVRQALLAARDDPAMAKRFREYLVVMDAAVAGPVPTAAARVKAMLTVRDESDSLIAWIDEQDKDASTPETGAGQ